MSRLSLRELRDIDSGATITSTFRTCKEGDNGDCTYVHDPEAATEMTFRNFLPPSFFAELDRLAASGADRIVLFCA